MCERCTQGKEKSPPSLYIWHAPSIIIVSLTALGGERYMHRTIGTYLHGVVVLYESVMMSES